MKELDYALGRNLCATTGRDLDALVPMPSCLRARIFPDKAEDKTEVRQQGATKFSWNLP